MSVNRRFNVRALRESMGKDQKAFAHTVGVDERTIRRWENDGVEPSPMAVRRLREIQQRTAESAQQQRSQGPQRREFEQPSPSVEPGSGVVPSRRAFLG